jgi:hypothetical protein
LRLPVYPVVHPTLLQTWVHVDAITASGDIAHWGRGGTYLEIDKVLKELSLTEEISESLHRIGKLNCQQLNFQPHR